MPGETDQNNEREDALEELRRAERLATVSRLGSYIAHELGTPLNVISGRAMMIASGETSGDDTLKSARIIVEQTNKLTATIKEFLSHARKPSGQKEPTEIYPLCERAIGYVEKPASRAKVEIVLDPESERVTLNVEAIKIIQVLTNLLTNSIKAMPEGGKVTIKIKRETRSGAKYVLMSVHDQGIGIAAEHIPNIFKLFYSTHGQSNGTGLGLSIAQGIIRDNSGWIDVESEVGKGSVFTVCLPEGEFNAGTHSDRR